MATIKDPARDGIAPATRTAAEVPALERLFTTPEMARLAAVTPRTLQSWVKAKRVPAIKLGRRCIRFHAPSVLAALKKFTIEAVH